MRSSVLTCGKEILEPEAETQTGQACKDLPSCDRRLPGMALL
jgi:hypothetical protein